MTIQNITTYMVTESTLNGLAFNGILAGMVIGAAAVTIMVLMMKLLSKNNKCKHDCSQSGDC